jgi:hypothetical protein
MHPTDLAILRELLHRYRDGVLRLAQLAACGGVPTDLREELARLEDRLAHLTTCVQQRELASWGDRNRTRPRQPPPQHLVEADRFSVSGARVTDSPPIRPAISGRWGSRRPH